MKIYNKTAISKMIMISGLIASFYFMWELKIFGRKIDYTNDFIKSIIVFLCISFSFFGLGYYLNEFKGGIKYLLICLACLLAAYCFGYITHLK